MIAADLLADGTDDDLGRLTLFTHGVDQAVLAAVAAAVVLALATGVRGAAAGGIAAAAAALTATAFFGGYLWSRGSNINSEVLIPIGMPLLTYPVGVWLSVASAGLIVARRIRVPPLWTQALLSGALAATLVAVGSGIGPFLAPDPQSLLTATKNQEVAVDNTVIVEAEDYRDLLAPGLNDQFGTLLAAIDLNAGAAPDPAVADWLTAEVAPAMTGLETQVGQIAGADSAVASVHSELVTAVDELSAYLALSAEYHRGGDPAKSRQALAQRRQAIDDHQAWLRGVGSL